ncbi:hypothetical protein EDC96DRAFT_506642 [Choanephora cucurbitarum]|nr:hypothetical protein EDC96DRAFT_506642 [Choanephora cucurbitarum]
MAYERNTVEGVRSWLTAEISSNGWSSASIAKGLTDDVMTTLVHNFQQFDNRMKQAILLGVICMRKADLIALGDDLIKVIQMALDDSDEFIKTTASILQHYPLKQQLDLTVDSWSSGFKDLLHSIGSKIREKGLNFHPLEDMIKQPAAREIPSFTTPNYQNYRLTETHHFSLTHNPEDIISAEARHARFKELVESEERSEQVQAAQQKRPGAELTGSMAKRVASPTNNIQNPFPYPPASAHRNSISSSTGGIPIARQGSVPPRGLALGQPPAPGASSLFTKRPSRPTPAGGLFIKQNKPSNGQRPVHRTSIGNAAALPRGLQKVQKTQMLDFSAATQFEQDQANAMKKAQDDIKAKAEAKKQEMAERKRKAQEEKRERDEHKRTQRAAAAAERAAAKNPPLPRSPISTPASPKTPTSPLSPKLKEHMFELQQPQEQHNMDEADDSNMNPSSRRSSAGKLTTF